MHSCNHRDLREVFSLLHDVALLGTIQKTEQCLMMTSIQEQIQPVVSHKFWCNFTTLHMIGWLETCLAERISSCYVRKSRSNVEKSHSWISQNNFSNRGKSSQWTSKFNMQARDWVTGVCVYLTDRDRFNSSEVKIECALLKLNHIQAKPYCTNILIHSHPMSIPSANIHLNCSSRPPNWCVQSDQLSKSTQKCPNQRLNFRIDASKLTKNVDPDRHCILVEIFNFFTMNACTCTLTMNLLVF